MSDRIHASTAAATGADGAMATAVRKAFCHLPGVDDAAASHLIGLASDMAIMSLLALSAYLMLLVGRVSFGQQAFFGIGAYASGVMSAMFGLPLAPALAVGVLLGALASWLLAFPTMRLSGLNYAVATLAFGEMCRIGLSWWHWQRPTEDGPVGPAGGEGFRDIRWLLENDVVPEEYLLLTLAVLVVVLAVLMLNERTRLGVALRMTGQDDLLTASQGVPVARMRLLAAAAAGGLAALGGGLYAHRTTYIEPALFDPMLGVHAVGYALLGGLGTALGPLLGVVLDLGLLDASRLLPGWRMVIFGGLVALFLRWRPRGLLDEVLVHRISQAVGGLWRRQPPAGPAPGRRATGTALGWCGLGVVGLAGLACAALLAMPSPAWAQSQGRPRLELQCVSYGMGPMLECTVDLKRRDGTPLDGAQVTLGALMPSMPMAHTVKPVRAQASGAPGRYKGTLELEMLGVWSVDIDITGPVRDKLARNVRVDECRGEARCPAEAVKPAGPGSR